LVEISCVYGIRYILDKPENSRLVYGIRDRMPGIDHELYNLLTQSNITIIKSILERVDLRDRTYFISKVLQNVLSSGMIGSVEELIKLYLSEIVIEERNTIASQLLFDCIKYRPILNFLLENGANIDYRYPKGFERNNLFYLSPFEWSVYTGDERIGEFLLEKGAIVDTDVRARAIFIDAIRSNNAELVMMILTKFKKRIKYETFDFDWIYGAEYLPMRKLLMSYGFKLGRIELKQKEFSSYMPYRGTASVRGGYATLSDLGKPVVDSKSPFAQPIKTYGFTREQRPPYSPYEVREFRQIAAEAARKSVSIGRRIIRAVRNLARGVGEYETDSE
jgi:hypothetical protein